MMRSTFKHRVLTAAYAESIIGWLLPVEQSSIDALHYVRISDRSLAGADQMTNRRETRIAINVEVHRCLWPIVALAYLLMSNVF